MASPVVNVASNVALLGMSGVIVMLPDAQVMVDREPLGPSPSATLVTVDNVTSPASMSVVPSTLTSVARASSSSLSL